MYGVVTSLLFFPNKHISKITAIKNKNIPNSDNPIILSTKKRIKADKTSTIANEIIADNIAPFFVIRLLDSI